MLRLERIAAAKSTGFDRPQLVEIITPRTNSAALSAADHLFAALVGSSGLSLELAGDAAARHLYARAADPALATRFALQLGAAYPQAHVRRVEDVDDPARLLASEEFFRPKASVAALACAHVRSCACAIVVCAPSTRRLPSTTSD